MIPMKTESAWRGTADCKACGIRDLVLFADLNAHDFGLIHAPIDEMEYAAGASMFTEGSAAKGIFTLRHGMVKLVRSTIDGAGQRQVRLRCGDADCRIGLPDSAGSHSQAVVQQSPSARPVDEEVAACAQRRGRLASRHEFWNSQAARR